MILKKKYFEINKVGESSGKPSTCIVKNVDGEVQKTKKELTELQKVNYL